MKERATLGIEDYRRKEQIESRILENLKERNQIEDNAKKAAEKKEVHKTELSFREQEKNLSRLAGAKVGEDGQRLAGVNYSAIFEARAKETEVQMQMRDFLEKIADKEFTVEIPDAK